MGGLAGIVCGLVAAAPSVLLLRKGRAGMGLGLAAVVFSFLLIQAAILVVWHLWPEELLPFGSLSALIFLLAVTVAVLTHNRR